MLRTRKKTRQEIVAEWRMQEQLDEYFTDGMVLLYEHWDGWWDDELDGLWDDEWYRDKEKQE